MQKENQELKEIADEEEAAAAALEKSKRKLQEQFDEVSAQLEEALRDAKKSQNALNKLDNDYRALKRKLEEAEGRTDEQ